MKFESIDRYLLDIGMHPDCASLELTTADFTRDMLAGLAGRESSLMMIPTYVGYRGRVENHQPVIALDAGGTHLRLGLVTFENGRPALDSLKTMPMPGARGAISKDEFFKGLAELIMPLADQSRKVGFCFSYPAAITPDRDGIVTSLTKEVKIDGLTGSRVGAELGAALESAGAGRGYSFTIINDTVAALLGGAIQRPEIWYDGLGGVVCGTGVNSCYLERGQRIKKLERPWDMIVILEAGNFHVDRRGRADCLLDEKTDNPGSWVYEKMISGEYLGRVICESARLAAEEGFFSPGFRAKIQALPQMTMRQVDQFIRDPSAEGTLNFLCGPDEDTRLLMAVISLCHERAAKLVCSMIAGLILVTDGGKTPRRPFLLLVEGALFHSSALFPQKLDFYLRDYIGKSLGRHIRLVKSENTNLVGAAVAALSGAPV